MIQFFRMIKQYSKKCFTLIQTSPYFLVPSGSKLHRFDPLQRHCNIRHRSNLPKNYLNFSPRLEKRQMSALPHIMPPVIHHAEKQEFTITIPGHESAYLRYTRNSHDGLTMFTTVVPDSLGGRGVAKLLADEAFEFAVKEQVGLKLTCWYLSGYLKRHPRDDVSRLLLD